MIKSRKCVNIMVINMSIVFILEDATANAEYLCMVNKNCERKNMAVCETERFYGFFLTTAYL
jgi:hypothetical protein